MSLPSWVADRRTRNLLMRILVGVAVVLVLAVIGTFLWIYPPTGSWIRSTITRLERHVVPQPHIVVMRAPSGNTRYTVSGMALKPYPSQAARTHASFFVDENAGPTQFGTPSLGAPVQDAPARTLALVTDDGRLIALAKTEGEMRDIAARTDGLIAFSAFTTSSTTTAPDTWHVMTADAAVFGGAQDIGFGSDPVFAKNGNILAFAPEGLVEINPFVSARTVRLAVPYAGAAGPTLIAPDATYAVLPNAVTGKEDVFSIDPAQPSVLSYLGSLARPQALGAFDATSFLAQTDAGTATMYTVSKTGITQGAAFTIAQ